MARAEAIAALLGEADQKTIAEIVKALKQLDANTDKRFEAFDEVVQQQLDAVEELEEAVEGITEAIGKINMPKTPDYTKDIKKLFGGLEDLASRLNVVANKPMESNKAEIAALKQDMLKVKQNQDRLEAMLGKLLTARRVPVRDARGNLIGVDLEG